jgi:hypothetical protein
MKEIKPRTIQQAMANAERLRTELPHLIQPSSTYIDIVVLADEVLKWRALAKRAADEAAGWYDDLRGGDRKDILVVREIDNLLSE